MKNLITRSIVLTREQTKKINGSSYNKLSCFHEAQRCVTNEQCCEITCDLGHCIGVVK